MRHALRTIPWMGPDVPAEGGAVATDSPDTLDTFLWQADPGTLRLLFVSGQVERILGAHAGEWLADRHPWRTIARGERHHIELALRHAVREVGDVELEFTATDTSGNSFAARLIIRVARPVGAPIRLWGLMTDCSREHREITRPVVRVPVTLIAPPIIRRATRFVGFCLAAIFATYALAVSAHRPMPAAPPTAAAIQRADRLGQALADHTAEEQVLESAIVSMEASVGELVGLGRLASRRTELDALRARIAELISMMPLELAGRLRALIAQIDRVTGRPVAPQVTVSKPSPPPAKDVAPGTEPEPQAASPSTAPAASAPAAPGEVPSASGAPAV